MIFSSKKSPNALIASELHDENTFYQAFTKDLLKCQQEVVIESPFITSKRMMFFRPLFQQLIDQGISVYVITRDPREHIAEYQIQSELEIQEFERIGIHSFLCSGNHHRKLAILDREILWEGSLNILSQTKSREIMRRIKGKELANQMFHFLKLEKLM